MFFQASLKCNLFFCRPRFLSTPIVSMRKLVQDILLNLNFQASRPASCRFHLGPALDRRSVGSRSSMNRSLLARKRAEKLVYDEKTESRDHIKGLLSESVTDDTPDMPKFPSDLKMDRDKHTQARHSFRPAVDPRETSIILFPGQGSQFVGMGRELLKYPNVPELYAAANKILGYDLLDLCLHGPKEELDKTIHCQPAVFVTSIAAVEKLKEDQINAVEQCISTSGFSVGEYAALVFAGSLTFEQGLELIKVRAEAMHRASTEVASGMMTVFTWKESKLKQACYVAREYCQERLGIPNPVCVVANYLCTDCKVVAGNVEALDFIEKNKKDFSLLRTKRLPVSGAFHSPLMRSAVEPMKKLLNDIDLKKPEVAVHFNVTALRHTNPIKMKSLLLEQLYKPVKWEQILHVLYSRKPGESFPSTYEVGPGRQLGSLLKATNKLAFDYYQNVAV